jgi:hypothetical protein
MNIRALCSMSALLLTFTAPAAAAPPDAALADGLEGRFAFSEQASERAALEQAIEATAQRLSFVVRGIARSRLRGSNRIVGWVEIHRRGDVVTVQYQGRPPMTAATNGAPVNWKNEEGATVRLQHRLDGNTLVQVLETGEGSRTNRLSVGPGGALRLAVEVASPRLPAPLKYVLTYPRSRG